MELQGQGPRVSERRALPLPWARQRQQVYQQACRWPVRLEGSRQALSSLGLGQRWEREQEQQELQRQEQEESLWHQRQESPAWQAPQLASPHLGFQA